MSRSFVAVILVKGIQMACGADMGSCGVSGCADPSVELLQRDLNIKAMQRVENSEQRCYNWPACGTPDCTSSSNGASLRDLQIQCHADDTCAYVSCHVDPSDPAYCQRYMFSATCDAQTRDNEVDWAIHQVSFDESVCVASCLESGYCCSDPTVGSNQYLSCSQACKIRASGVNGGDCSTSCDEPRSCSRTVGSNTFTMCQSCNDITSQCPHGVQNTDACHAGCGHLVNTFTLVEDIKCPDDSDDDDMQGTASDASVSADDIENAKVYCDVRSDCGGFSYLPGNTKYGIKFFVTTYDGTEASGCSRTGWDSYVKFA